MFTDIAGSTQLLTTLGDEGYEALLGRHNEILRAALAEHDDSEAADAAREALRGFQEMGNVGLYPMAIKAIAAFELADNRDPERVVTLAAAAERLFDELGGQLAVMARFGDPLSEARQSLGDERWARAVEKGRAMDVQTAVAHALESSEVATDG